MGQIEEFSTVHSLKGDMQDIWEMVVGVSVASHPIPKMLGEGLS